jgi:hypothetical protein
VHKRLAYAARGMLAETLGFNPSTSGPGSHLLEGTPVEVRADIVPSWTMLGLGNECPGVPAPGHGTPPTFDTFTGMEAYALRGVLTVATVEQLLLAGPAQLGIAVTEGFIGRVGPAGRDGGLLVRGFG